MDKTEKLEWYLKMERGIDELIEEFEQIKADINDAKNDDIKKSEAAEEIRSGEKVRLGDLNPGDSFYIKGVPYTVLDKKKPVYSPAGDVGVLVLRDELAYDEMQFDSRNFNNWNISSLRKNLNEEWATISEIKDLKCGKDIMLTPRDFTAEDGTVDCGIASELIFLLTADEYRKNRKYIKNINKWWWLSTPDSCDNALVRQVKENGTLGHNYANNSHCGVRPAFTMSPSFLVDVRAEAAEED